MRLVYIICKNCDYKEEMVFQEVKDQSINFVYCSICDSFRKLKFEKVKDRINYYWRTILYPFFAIILLIFLSFVISRGGLYNLF